MNYGVEYERGSTPFNGGYPCYNIYRTKDGKYITIGCIEPVFWINLCRFVGREDFIPDQLCEAEKKQQIFSYICDFFLNKNRDEWFELMKDKNIPVGKVYDLNELNSDPQIQHRGMLKYVKTDKGRPEKMVNTGIKLSTTPGGIARAAPLLGEHTVTILLQSGYSKSEIEELRNKGVI
jgi:crotonobetainyl-CoA:carnitine CoA-transferase CaiB-like acyl-CoA transferase